MRKEDLVEAMSRLDNQTLSLAYAYAVSLTSYGVDVREQWITATQQYANLQQAYLKGYQDAIDTMTERQTYDE